MIIYKLETEDGTERYFLSSDAAEKARFEWAEDYVEAMDYDTTFEDIINDGLARVVNIDVEE